MKTRIATLLSALALLTVSCEQNPDEGSVWDDPKFVRLVAPTEKVKSGNTEVELFYKEGQQIKVWDQVGNALDLEINKDNDSVFFSYNWIPDAVPAYAAFPSAEETLCNDGVFEVMVGTQQKVSSANRIQNFVAVGRVTGANRTSYKSSPVRNITGFLCFEVAFPNISSIKIETVGGEPLAGKVSVDCSKLENSETDYMTVAAAEAVPSVTLVPEDSEGTLDAGVYYAAVLPGTYAKGLRLTVNYKSGLPVEKIFFADGVTVLRSSLVVLGDEPMDDDLPDEMRVDLKFSEGWPFVGPIVSADTQEAGKYAGDTYIHMVKYEVDGVEKEKGLAFFIKGNNASYSYNNGALLPGAKNSRMTLPAISGRYIKAVRMEVKNGSAYPKGFKLTSLGWKDLAECPQKAYSGSPAMISFPSQDGVVSEFEAAYYMYFSDANATISTISILYSKELPSEYDDDPFDDKSHEPDAPQPPVVPETDLPAEFQVDLDFATWPFVESVATNEVQTAENYTGDTYTYNYTYQADGEQKTEKLSFLIKHNGVTYTHLNGTLRPGDTVNTRMTLPAISGRYIRAVRMEVDNGYAKSFRLDNKNFTPLATSSGGTADAPALLSFPTEDGVVSESGTLYYMYFINKSTLIKKISILYSKELPSEYVEDPFAAAE